MRALDRLGQGRRFSLSSSTCPKAPSACSTGARTCKASAKTKSRSRTSKASAAGSERVRSAKCRARGSRDASCKWCRGPEARCRRNESALPLRALALVPGLPRRGLVIGGGEGQARRSGSVRAGAGSVQLPAFAFWGGGHLTLLAAVGRGLGAVQERRRQRLAARGIAALEGHGAPEPRWGRRSLVGPGPPTLTHQGRSTAATVRARLEYILRVSVAKRGDLETPTKSAFLFFVRGEKRKTFFYFFLLGGKTVFTTPLTRNTLSTNIPLTSLTSDFR